MLMRSGRRRKEARPQPLLIQSSIWRTNCRTSACQRPGSEAATAWRAVIQPYGTQCHMNEAGACTRHQIEKIEIEKRSAVEKQKTLLQQDGRVSQGTRGPEWLSLQRDREARASPDCARIARQNMLGPIAGQQQNFLERIVPRDFVDQRIEKWPAADVQH